MSGLFRPANVVDGSAHDRQLAEIAAEEQSLKMGGQEAAGRDSTWWTRPIAVSELVEEQPFVGALRGDQVLSIDSLVSHGRIPWRQRRAALAQAPRLAGIGVEWAASAHHA